MADIDQIIAGGAKTNANFNFGSLLDAYYKGRDQAYQQEGRDLFANGVPQGPNGDDYGAMARALFQHGDVNQGVALSNLDLSRQKLQYGQKVDSAINPSPDSSNATVVSPPSSNRNASAVVAKPLNRGGLDNSGGSGAPSGGGSTITQVVAASGIPNDQVQAASASVARQLGVDDPNSPIDLQDPRVRNVIVPAIQQLKRAGIGQVVPSGAPAPPPQTLPPVAPQAASAPPPTVAPPQQTAPQTPSFDQRFAGLVPSGRTAEQQLFLLNRAIGSGLLTPEQAKSYETQRDAIIKAYQPTDEEKAFLASKRNPGLDEYTASKAADAESAKAVAAADVKEQNDIIGAGREAQQRLQTLNTVANIIQTDKNLTLGFGAETALKVKKALQQAGFNVGDLSGAQAIDKLNAALASEAAKGVSARPAQFEFKTFLANNPGLSMDKAGNLRVIGIFSQLAKRDIELGKLARQNRDNWQNWDNVVAAYDKKFPIVDPVTKNPITTNSIIAPGPAQSSSQPSLEAGKTTINGYTYKGGNPNNRANWEQRS